MVLTPTETGIAESYSEIVDALNRGIIPILILNSTEGDDTTTVIFSVTGLQTSICPDQGYTIYSCSGNVLGESQSIYATDENSPMSFTMPECTGK